MDVMGRSSTPYGRGLSWLRLLFAVLGHRGVEGLGQGSPLQGPGQAPPGGGALSPPQSVMAPKVPVTVTDPAWGSPGSPMGGSPGSPPLRTTPV